MTGVMGEILEHYGQTVTLRSRDGDTAATTPLYAMACFSGNTSIA